MLENLQNYGIYASLVRNGSIVVKSTDISIQNWISHYEGIMNILKDGIETNYVQSLFITVEFPSGESVDLVINDYLINLQFWYIILALEDTQLGPQHIVFEKSFTSGVIKKYVDKFFILPHRGKVPNKTLNNVIADFLHHFVNTDRFSLFLANTLNLEDSIELMNKSQEYCDLLHADLSGEPLDNVKNKGMELVKKAQKIIENAENIMGHEHCLRAPFAADTGISAKQYKENSINIGTKPDGRGSVYHDIINHSYITGGLNNLMYQYIDSSQSRVSQIMSKLAVGVSGGFARILGLSSIHTYLNPDMDHDCGTNNYITQVVESKEILKMLYGRYYKFNYQDRLRRIEYEDDFLIGKTILLRSPIHCISHASGHGICRYCYGDLAFTNADISVGRYATEAISEKYTQMRLSAKHLMESKIKVINWSEDFKRFFNLDTNSVQIRHDIDYTTLKGWRMLLSFSDIQLENDADFFKHDYYMDENNYNVDDGPFFNEYITEFSLISPDDSKVITISGTVEEDIDEGTIPVKMFLTDAFGSLIRKNISIDDDSDCIEIPLNEMADIDILLVKMENNDLGKSLDMFNDLVNKKDITKSYNASDLIMKIQSVVLKGNMSCASVHLEVIISNQIRAASDRMLMPNWFNFNEPYEVLTLNEALKDNPDIIICLTYQKLADALKYPLNFKKFGASVFDLFFMRKPMKFLNAQHDILDIPGRSTMQRGDSPVVYMHDRSEPYAPDLKPYMQKYDPRPNTRLDG